MKKKTMTKMIAIALAGALMAGGAAATPVFAAEAAPADVIAEAQNEVKEEITEEAPAEAIEETEQEAAPAVEETETEAPAEETAEAAETEEEITEAAPAEAIEETEQEAAPAVEETETEAPAEETKEAVEKVKTADVREEAPAQAAPENETENQTEEKAETKKTVKKAGAMVKAAAGEITANINIFVNGKQKATDVMTQSEFFELEYGTVPFGYKYGDVYGTYQKGTCTINGSNCYWYCFDGENGSFFKRDFSQVTGSDVVVVNLYYLNDAEEEEEVFGAARLYITDGRNPVEGVEVTFTGKKGAETVTKTFTSDANGILDTKDTLDESYTWTYMVEDLTYNVMFTDHLHKSDHVVAPAVKEPVIRDVKGSIEIYVNGDLWSTKDLFDSNNEDNLKQGVLRSGYGNSKLAKLVSAEVTVNGTVRNAEIAKNSNSASFEIGDTLEGELNAKFYFEYTDEAANETYTLNVRHEFKGAPGGTMTDGRSEGEDVKVFESRIEELKGGETVSYADILLPEEATSLEDGEVLYNGDVYRLGAVYKSGGSDRDHSFTGSVSDAGSDLTGSFTMIHGDVDMTFSYTFVCPHYNVTVNYLDSESGEEIFASTVRSFRGTSTLEGEQTYDMSDCAEHVIAGYTLDSVDGELTGNCDSDKTINLYYAADAAEEEAETEETEEDLPILLVDDQYTFAEDEEDEKETVTETEETVTEDNEEKETKKAEIKKETLKEDDVQITPVQDTYIAEETETVQDDLAETEEAEETELADTFTENVATGDRTNVLTFIIAGIAAAAGVVGTGVALLKRRNRKDDDQ